MRIAIIQFPGSNCERETMLAVKRAGMVPQEFLWNEPASKLKELAGYIIVGGFSYEDRSRAGIIAALDPLISLLKEQSQLGKPILGICNGAQILVEAGLVPGLAHHQVGMALTDNKRIAEGKVLGTGYYNAWVKMRVSDEYQLNAFTRCLTPKQILSIPVAHGEGRFVIPPALLLEMQAQGLNVFQYCNAAGNIIDEFPVNPNGSVNNIAAVSNKAGNVMAMMPHPERTVAGDPIFQSMRDYIESGYVQAVTPLYYAARPISLTKYQTTQQEFIIDSIITDNQALSVQQTLHHLQMPVQVQRYVHWEVMCESPDTLTAIKNSGVLYNDRKEELCDKSFLTKKNDVPTQIFLVRAKEETLGPQKKQMLEDHFHMKGIQSIRHSVLWKMTAPNLLTHLDSIIHSHILFNPYAHECYDYEI